MIIKYLKDSNIKLKLFETFIKYLDFKKRN